MPLHDATIANPTQLNSTQLDPTHYQSIIFMFRTAMKVRFVHVWVILLGWKVIAPYSRHYHKFSLLVFLPPPTGKRCIGSHLSCITHKRFRLSVVSCRQKLDNVRGNGITQCIMIEAGQYDNPTIWVSHVWSRAHAFHKVEFSFSSTMSSSCM